MFDPNITEKRHPCHSKESYIELKTETEITELSSPFISNITKYVNLKKDQSSSSSDEFPSADVTV